MKNMLKEIFKKIKPNTVWYDDEDNIRIVEDKEGNVTAFENGYVLEIDNQEIKEYIGLGMHFSDFTIDQREVIQEEFEKKEIDLSSIKPNFFYSPSSGNDGMGDVIYRYKKRGGIEVDFFSYETMKGLQENFEKNEHGVSFYEIGMVCDGIKNNKLDKIFGFIFGEKVDL